MCIASSFFHACSLLSMEYLSLPQLLFILNDLAQILQLPPQSFKTLETSVHMCVIAFMKLCDNYLFV